MASVQQLVLKRLPSLGYKQAPASLDNCDDKDLYEVFEFMLRSYDSTLGWDAQKADGLSSRKAIVRSLRRIELGHLLPSIKQVNAQNKAKVAQALTGLMTKLEDKYGSALPKVCQKAAGKSMRQHTTDLENAHPNVDPVAEVSAKPFEVSANPFGGGNKLARTPPQANASQPQHLTEHVASFSATSMESDVSVPINPFSSGTSLARTPPTSSPAPAAGGNGNTLPRTPLGAIPTVESSALGAFKSAAVAPATTSAAVTSAQQQQPAFAATSTLARTPVAPTTTSATATSAQQQHQQQPAFAATSTLARTPVAPTTTSATVTSAQQQHQQQPAFAATSTLARTPVAPTTTSATVTSAQQQHQQQPAFAATSTLARTPVAPTTTTATVTSAQQQPAFAATSTLARTPVAPTTTTATVTSAQQQQQQQPAFAATSTLARTPVAPTTTTHIATVTSTHQQEPAFAATSTLVRTPPLATEQQPAFAATSTLTRTPVVDVSNSKTIHESAVAAAVVPVHTSPASAPVKGNEENVHQTPPLQSYVDYDEMPVNQPQTPTTPKQAMQMIMSPFGRKSIGGNRIARTPVANMDAEPIAAGPTDSYAEAIMLHMKSEKELEQLKSEKETILRTLATARAKENLLREQEEKFEEDICKLRTSTKDVEDAIKQCGLDISSTDRVALGQVKQHLGAIQRELRETSSEVISLKEIQGRPQSSPLEDKLKDAHREKAELETKIEKSKTSLKRAREDIEDKQRELKAQYDKRIEDIQGRPEMKRLRLEHSQLQNELAIVKKNKKDAAVERDETPVTSQLGLCAKRMQMYIERTNMLKASDDVLRRLVSV